MFEAGISLKSRPLLATLVPPERLVAGFSTCKFASLLIGVPSTTIEVPKELTADDSVVLRSN